MQVEVFRTHDLTLLVEKLLFLEKYIGNFIEANPNYKTIQKVIITENNEYELIFKIWKIEVK